MCQLRMPWMFIFRLRAKAVCSNYRSALSDGIFRRHNEDMDFERVPASESLGTAGRLLMKFHHVSRQRALTPIESMLRTVRETVKDSVIKSERANPTLSSPTRHYIVSVPLSVDMVSISAL